MTKLGSELVRDYLKRLDRATRGIPGARRRELREEIEQHLAQAIPADASEADVKEALKRLGTPRQVADAECSRLGSAIPSWPGFFVWVLIGAATALGLITLGTLAIPPIFLGVWVAAKRPALRRSGFGLSSGVGIPLLYVAYVQRLGPGTACWHTATASGCDEYANPWPWLIIGLAFLLAGVIAHARKMRPAN